MSASIKIVERATAGAGKKLAQAFTLVTSRVLFGIYQAMAAQRMRQAQSIVDEYRQDRWSDTLEREVEGAHNRSPQLGSTRRYP